MKLLLFLSLLLTSTLCLTTLEMRLLGDLFKTWIIAYKKQYPTMGQEATHCARFIINYMAIQDFNAQNEGVTLGINEFADLSSEEFAALYTGTFAPRSQSQGSIKVFNTQNLPSSFDWRDKGAVTPVKNQGACGSCWAFSATGALEGLYFVNNSKLVSFSEQNLVDCVIEDFGCGGGWPIDAMSYSAKGGILSEDDYPYIAHRQKCAFDASKAYHVNDGYFNVTPNNLDQMKAAITTQPISIGIQANQLVFQFYKSGVIKKFCGDSIDHGVLIVGYKEVSGTEAFIVKNSWGPKWGVDGYVYISTDPSANNGKGVCGILSMGAAPYKNKRSISI